MEERTKTQGIVQQVNNKDGKYGVKVSDVWYNGFGECEAKEGDSVAIEYVVNGQWKNVKLFSITNVAPKSVGQEIRDESTKRKTASVMISYAKDLVVAGKIDLDQIADKARGFMKLQEELVAGKIPEKLPEEKSSDIKEVKVNVEDFI